MKLSDGMELLKRYGIPIPRYCVTEKLGEAKRFSENVGYPVVLKINSPVHKTDIGGVSLGVCKENIEREFKKILKLGKEVVVQEQVKGIETIVGCIKDSQFGRCISFGGGGIFVEVLKDVNFRVCPITKKDAISMIKESRIYKVLRECRGKKYNIEGIVDVLVKVSKLALKERVNELDINPLICSEKKVWAVDVRI